MNIHFTGRNIEITPALKIFTTEKMDRITRRFSEITNMNVVFHLENVDHVAEATVQFHGTDIHATAKSEDMYAAIDELADKLAAQITKHKEKLTDHR